MNKLFIAAGVIFLSLIAAAGVKFFKLDSADKLTHQSSDSERYDMTINVYRDNFEGYRIACSDHMESQLRKAKYRLNCVDDGADYTKRMKALKSGDAQFAMLEVGAYAIEGEDYKYPASIIATIDTSYGADAIVANKTLIPNIEALKSKPNVKVALTPNSPSDVFAKIASSHFDLNLNNVVEAESSLDAMRKLMKGEVAVAVVWEPHVSKLLATGDYVKIISTKEAQDTIVDALAVNREFGEKHPEVVKTFLSSYFKSLKYYKDNPSELVSEIKADTGLKEEEIKNLVAGINWVSLNENCKRWFACDPQDWSAKVKIADSLEKAHKIWKEAGVQSDNPYPNEDAYSLINSEFMFDLLKNGVGLYSNADIEDSLEKEFPAITEAQWKKLKDFGKLKQRAILFIKSNELRLTSKEAIDEIAKDLEHYPNYRIRIEGHTGTLGDAVKNQAISESRAAWVKRYLTQTYGVDEDRIWAVGFGGNKPLKRKNGESEYSKSYQSKLSRVSIVLMQEEY